jgi:hypothetical protein
MKREQAVRINDHLLDACRALDQARMGIAALGKAESDSDRIEGIGDLRNWSGSEVRLKD